MTLNRHCSAEISNRAATTMQEIGEAAHRKLPETAGHQIKSLIHLSVQAEPEIKSQRCNQ